MRKGSTDNRYRPRARIPIEERFWAKVDMAGPLRSPYLGPCWIWTASQYGSGYAQLGRGGRGAGNVPAHRFAYELMVGPIPDGLVLDHLCRVRHCVNPAHLEAVTNAENIRRGNKGRSGREKAMAKYAARTHCANGHAYAEHRYRSSGPWGSKWVCRACNTEWARRKRVQARAASGVA